MHSKPDAQTSCAAPPAKPETGSPLPEWQRQRVQLLSDLCAEIHALIGQGKTMREATAAVSQAALERKAAEGIPRCPLSPQALTRFYYCWLEGPEYLQQNFGGALPTIPAADALAFLNWLIGRRARSFGPTWQEFCEHHQPKRKQTAEPDVRDWFARFRQRIARCDARMRKRGGE